MTNLLLDAKLVKSVFKTSLKNIFNTCPKLVLLKISKSKFSNRLLKKSIPFFVIFIVFTPSTIIADDTTPYDPLETVNRNIFSFNDFVDRNLMTPISEGYKSITTTGMRRSVGNFFSNLKFPVHFVSDIAQLKFDQAAIHSARFLLNSSVGLGGLFDVANHHGIKPHEEDMGITLGYYGVPSGPYLVIPFLGPSNARDFIGGIADGFLDPIRYTGQIVSPQRDANIIQISASVLSIIDTRARLLQATNMGRESSLDYYSFVKNSLHQRRRGLIYDGFPPDDEFFEDEFDDEDE